MKTKIVINRPNVCCGRFELSDLATSLLNKLLKTSPNNPMTPYGTFKKPFYFKDEKIISNRIPRHNKWLVQVVELLGEKANGKYCKLRIEEIKGYKYLIMNDINMNDYIITPKTVKWIKVI